MAQAICKNCGNTGIGVFGGRCGCGRVPTPDLLSKDQAREIQELKARLVDLTAKIVADQKAYTAEIEVYKNAYFGAVKDHQMKAADLKSKVWAERYDKQQYRLEVIKEVEQALFGDAILFDSHENYVHQLVMRLNLLKEKRDD